MKQLDDERCARYPNLDTTVYSPTSTFSHSESFVGTTLRRLLPTRTSRTQAEGRDTREPRHDHPHYHAHPSTRSRSHGIQNEPRRPRWCFLRRYWRSWRASARTARGAFHSFDSFLLRAYPLIFPHPLPPLAHTHHRSSSFPSSTPNSFNASASRPRKVYFSMAHPGQGRRYSRVQSPQPSRPTFSKWSLPLS